MIDNITDAVTLSNEAKKHLANNNYKPSWSERNLHLIDYCIGLVTGLAMAVAAWLLGLVVLVN